MDVGRDAFAAFDHPGLVPRDTKSNKEKKVDLQ
jgi:hypothetical protein